MHRISPCRRLPQSLRLLLFIGISSAAVSSANYTLDGSYRAQSLSTSISSPWPPTRVRNIKGAVPPKTKSTGDVTSLRRWLLVADGDSDATADSLEEIGKKSGGGDFRGLRDFKADAIRTRDHSVLTDFKPVEKSDLSKLTKLYNLKLTFVESQENRPNSRETKLNRTPALLEVNGTRKKREDYWHFAVPNFWTYQPQGYLYYGFGMPTVLIQWPTIPMQSLRQVYSHRSQSVQQQKLNANEGSMIKSGIDFNNLNYEDDENFVEKEEFEDEDNYDDEGHDEYHEHVYVNKERDHEEDNVRKIEQPETIKPVLYSGTGKSRPIFPNRKSGSAHAKTVKKPLPPPTPKKQAPLAHWLQHIYPPWPKNKTF